MKIIPLNEAQANLSYYGRLCRDEPIIVTVDGSPAFQLVPVDEDDDLVDRILASNPDFRRTMDERQGESTVSAQDAADRL